MPVYPISFSIPASKIIATIPAKTQRMASLVPGDVSTYTFTDEKSYYEGYAKSVFGKTWRKGGWDCMRHYEILANGCIPWFEGLEECPSGTMTHFPKELVKQAMVSDEPETFIPALLDHTRKHCTTSAIAQYVLDKTGHSSAKRVLYLSEQPVPDYLREMLLIGFKEILGKGCAESIVLPYIYEDYGDTTKIYGRGFSYSKNIPVGMKPDLVHVDDIKNHVFDLVIYGSMHRGMPCWDLVNKHYAPSDIVLVCGEDTCDDTHSLAERGYHVFIRELVSIQRFATRIDMIETMVEKGSVIAELGVFQGSFMKDIYNRTSPVELVGIDLFEGIMCSGDQDGNNVQYISLDSAYNELKQYASERPGLSIRKGYSTKELETFPDDYFDMIYIDADHTYNGCKADLEIAYRKSKNGGLVMGHDYEMNMLKATTRYEFGVKQAVDEFCKSYKQAICAKGYDGCVSYAIRIAK